MTQRTAAHNRLAAAVMGAVICLSAASLPGSASAAGEPQWRHATALTGTPKYGPEVTHFDYVNPEAPKGGLVRLSMTGGFDTFNPILPKGNAVLGLGLVYETLMSPAMDEYDISAEYGLIADAVRYPDDFSWVDYRINPKARWQDGEPVTAEDVVWTFEQTIKLDPRQAFYYHDVKSAKVVDGNIVHFEFTTSGNRELPKIVGGLLILPRHWWEGTNAKGQKRDISRGLQEPPMGSGPYRVKDFSFNRRVTYERVKDYWGKDLPVRVGTNNFDEIRYDSYRDSAVLFEAFKGDQYDWRRENVARNWATGYEFPAVKDGRVIKESFPDHGSGIMQAFVPNLRRDKFKDERVRRALNLAFDFETTNHTSFFDQYKRITSFFAGTELASSGLPQGRELEILDSVRDLVPASVFTEPYKNPVGGNPTKMRANLREALKLLTDAGYKLEGRTLVNAKTGEPFKIEFIAQDPSSERYVLPFANNLKLIGIELTVRVLDTPQYINRVRSRDFDMATLLWGQSLSPGNEQRDYWGSASADKPQSYNYAGIKDPGIDALIDKVIFAKDREELVAATHALDRVLMAHNYVIPQWYLDVDRTARWDRFGHPDNIPEYTSGFPIIWWYDEARAAKTGVAK